MGTDKVAFEEDRAEDRTVFFYHIFFPYFFPCINFPYFLFLYFFPFYFPVLFQKFEIERFKISVSCFSSTYRYNTVHVPCGISIQTSPVWLPLGGWGARMRDLKGPKMNLFKAKED
jgi:hypothetical protein